MNANWKTHADHSEESAVDGGHTWEAYLRDRISLDWRPGQFDAELLVWVPDPLDPTTVMSECVKPGCRVRLQGGSLCAGCQKARDIARSQRWYVEEDWMREARSQPLRTRSFGCKVPECGRSHGVGGLCAAHFAAFHSYRKRRDLRPTLDEWLSVRKRRVLPDIPKCMAPCCPYDSWGAHSLCANHTTQYRRWAEKQDADFEIDDWLRRIHEPRGSHPSGRSYAELMAVQFGAMRPTVSLELLFAIQQRDSEGVARLDPVFLRRVVAHFRREDIASAVGLDRLGLVHAGKHSNLQGFLKDMQYRIDEAHRLWSGVDRRPANVYFIRDLDMRYSKRDFGRGASVDITAVTIDWLHEITHAVITTDGPHGYSELQTFTRVARVVNDVLCQRRTAPQHLLAADMDAIVKQVRKKWPTETNQRRYLGQLRRLVEYGRSNMKRLPIWRDIPAEFRVDPVRHAATGTPTPAESDEDEAFRYVPQPIVDWLLDHLHLLRRRHTYQTVEARVMLYVLERCGRRPGETVSLKDECISFDDAGNPYLEWERGKKPWGKGRRLPIQPETFEEIQAWRAFKREAGIESKWLFPSVTRHRNTRHVETTYLNRRLKDLVDAVMEHAPFQGKVDTAEGNMVYFDFTTLDPVSFRHAFAQRHADATDASGRHTVDQRSLQELMDHKNANTTAAYYEVTARRLHGLVSALPARRINHNGEVVRISRERESFNRIAVSLGSCSEAANVRSGGTTCALAFACESCPFFLVDPFEREGVVEKRIHLRMQVERVRIIAPDSHLIAHYRARIDDCERIIAGIDHHVSTLPPRERAQVEETLEKLRDVRRRATAPRVLHVRELLRDGVS